MASQTAYFDRPLELLVERWAKEHRLMKEVKLPDSSKVLEPDVPAAIVAIVREYLQAPKTAEGGSK